VRWSAGLPIKWGRSSVSVQRTCPLLPGRPQQEKHRKPRKETQGSTKARPERALYPDRSGPERSAANGCTGLQTAASIFLKCHPLSGCRSLAVPHLQVVWKPDGPHEGGSRLRRGMRGVSTLPSLSSLLRSSLRDSWTVLHATSSQWARKGGGLGCPARRPKTRIRDVHTPRPSPHPHTPPSPRGPRLPQMPTPWLVCWWPCRERPVRRGGRGAG